MGRTRFSSLKRKKEKVAGESQLCLSLLSCFFLTQKLNFQCLLSGLGPPVRQSPGFITTGVPWDPPVSGHRLREGGRHRCRARAVWVYATAIRVGAAACRKTGRLKMMYGPHVQGSRACLFICRKALLANTSFEGTTQARDDAGQGMPLRN